MQLLDDPSVFFSIDKLMRSTTNTRVDVSPKYGMFCPKCGDTRRMNVLVGPDWVQRQMFVLHCSQCLTEFTALAYPGPGGQALAIFPSVLGGLRTPHTPDGVAFYLDQAHRAQSVGAYSAAIAMYRGALEHVLFEEGYRTGMLGTKIGALNTDVAAGKGPKWAREMDRDFLDVLKDLGNGAIHPNDGDVTKQVELDATLVSMVQDTFLCLLFLAYEVEKQKAERLAHMQKRAAVLKK